MAVNGIIGIKLGMTQVFVEDGTLVGCTVLQAGPCVVVQRRTKENDGYEAAQLGLVEFVKPQRVRSEEHTSELQSRLHLVCRLLLEKKKKNLYNVYQSSDGVIVSREVGA